MTLALRPGLTAVVVLVIGCSSTGPTAPDRVDMGDMNLVPSDPAPEKKPTSATTANSTTDGMPVPYPSAPIATTAPATSAAPKVRSKLTFFVTSTGSGAQGGNLGGLDGADKKCQELAAAVSAGDHTWHAYLSATGVNAKDRIGAGPWVNQKGVTVAESLTSLHDNLFVPPTEVIVDETGAAVPLTATAILTGTKGDGTALEQTCQNWTSNTAQQRGQVGDAAAATSVILGARWNDAVKSYGCAQTTITQNKGEGRLYCFAVD